MLEDNGKYVFTGALKPISEDERKKFKIDPSQLLHYREFILPYIPFTFVNEIANELLFFKFRVNLWKNFFTLDCRQNDLVIELQGKTKRKK